MKDSDNKNPVLAVCCPTCGAKPGEKCELATGQPRTNPHFDRRVIAKDVAHSVTLTRLPFLSLSKKQA